MPQDVFDSTSTDISLEKPQRGGKDGYLNRFFRSGESFDRMVADSNGVRDHRFRLMILRQINMITDDTGRKKLNEYFQQEIERIQNLGLDADETNQRIADFCCGEMSGHITAWFDEFMGITHRLTIGMEDNIQFIERGDYDPDVKESKKPTEKQKGGGDGSDTPISL